MYSNDSSWAPAHNTPLPLERSPPVSFKRLLGGRCHPAHRATVHANDFLDNVTDPFAGGTSCGAHRSTWQQFTNLWDSLACDDKRRGTLSFGGRAPRWWWSAGFIPGVINGNEHSPIGLEDGFQPDSAEEIESVKPTHFLGNLGIVAVVICELLRTPTLKPGKHHVGRYLLPPNGPRLSCGRRARRRTVG